MRRTLLGGLAAGMSGLVLPHRAHAQTPAASGSWPTRPVRIIVGLGPGSGADTGSRFIAERIGKLSGQPVTVENRPGGDGVVAVQALLSAPADGHTLLYLSPSPMVLTPLLNRETPYDALRDIRPVAYLSRSYAVIVTGTNSKYRTLDDLLKDARSRPGMLKMSNYGHHYRIGGLLLQKVSGADFIHVSYKGAAQASNDVASGEIDVAITDTGGAIPLIKAGKLRPLAITGPSRHPFLPEVPSMKDLGLDYVLQVWTGYGMSSKAPEAVARAAQDTLLAVMKSPEYATYNQNQAGAETVAEPGESLRQTILAETQRYRELGKTVNLHGQ
jgi:tripartite-type tricarboxylate transporter receptor subunit TctC